MEEGQQLRSSIVEYHAHDFEWASLRESGQRAVRAQALQQGPPPSGVADLGPVTGEGQVAAWESFHRRHSRVTFFKERRYVLAEFPELARNEGPLLILEVGCGTGSACIPILRGNAAARVVACDCSAAAVGGARAAVAAAIGPDEASQRFASFVHDVTSGNLRGILQPRLAGASKPAAVSTDGDAGLPHVVLLMFTLSAMEPRSMAAAARELHSVLRPGGLLLFRDYGLYDMSMLRFHGRQRLDERFYRRDDGTLVTFFTTAEVCKLFCEAGFVQVENEFCCVQHRNRSTGVELKRVFVHAKFVKALRTVESENVEPCLESANSKDVGFHDYSVF